MSRSIPAPPPSPRGEPGDSPAVRAISLHHLDGAASRDAVAVEEPLEIRLHGVPYAVTLRTPGEDEELAAGFLHAEGVLGARSEIASLERLDELPRETRPNVLDVRLRSGPPARAQAGARLVTSACGLCGRQSLESLARRAAALGAGPLVAASLLARLPESLARAQRAFAATGGLHAAGLFDARGELLVAREDVGRHNAVDKVVGWALLAGRLPLSSELLAVSGRAGFEILQKAWLAGVPIVVAVSAPSSLAVDLAREAGMTLVAFARGGTGNVYSGGERVLASA